MSAFYLIPPFLTALPVAITLVKWRNASFRNKRFALEFLGYFAFLIFNFFFMYQQVYAPSYHSYISKIIDPFFLLFLVQLDLSYSIDRKRQIRLFILMLENAFLQVLIHSFLKDVYAYDLIDLFALLFSVYVAIRIGKEYYYSAYMPKISRYLLILSAVMCLLFDAYVFRIFFVSLVFYLCMEKRHGDLSGLRIETENLFVEQERFRTMMSDISNSIKDFSNKKAAADSYLDSLIRFLSARGAAIYEWDKDKKYFSCIATAGLYFPLGIGSEKLFTRPDLLREIAFKQYIKDERSVIWKCGHSGGTGMHLNHLSDDMDYIFGNLSQEIHSIILIPLLQETELLGVLVVENKAGSDYLTETDFNMARSFANFAAIILNTSRIATQRNENMRMSMELNSGNIIQNSLFPQKAPQLAGMEVSFFMLPAKEIGGDYYDFIEKGDKVGVVIGDVSGKGVPAGILVAVMQTYLQNQYKKETDLKSLIVNLNNYLSHKITTEMFVTLLFFEWDSKRNKLRYVSCGHEYILHYKHKEKTIESIRSGGLALMMDSDIEPYITDCELAVEKGDSVILYTDGVTETFNAEREIFGLERLVKFFEHNLVNKNSVERLLPRTLADWRSDALQSDDITCVLMQF